jgi:hypothetical protein
MFGVLFYLFGWVGLAVWLGLLLAAWYLEAAR